jgi:hypothetical protein
MLKSKNSYAYHHLPIPSYLVIEGFGYVRFKTKEELKQDFKYYFKKLLYKFKKPVISNKDFYYSTKSLSSFDYHIRDKGGIVDQEGNVHTTASSYKDYLKKNDLVIKDWSDNNSDRMQLSDRNEVAKIVNKYI